MSKLNLKSLLQKKGVWAGIILLSFILFGGGIITTLLFLVAILFLSPFVRKMFFNPLNLLILPYGILLIRSLYRQNSVLVFMNIRNAVFSISIVFLLIEGIILLLMKSKIKENHLSHSGVIFLGRLIFLTILVIVFTNYSWAMTILLANLCK